MDFYDEQAYRRGFNLALDDIDDEGLPYAERHADNLPEGSWMVVGYRTAVDRMKNFLLTP